jgi:hypothetical protein
VLGGETSGNGFITEGEHAQYFGEEGDAGDVGEYLGEDGDIWTGAGEGHQFVGAGWVAPLTS